MLYEFADKLGGSLWSQQERLIRSQLPLCMTDEALASEMECFRFPDGGKEYHWRGKPLILIYDTPVIEFEQLEASTRVTATIKYKTYA